MFQIEISNGIDLYNKYLFVPVKISGCGQIICDEVSELDPMIDIPAIHTECFLFYFLRKYFNSSLDENKRRITNWRNDNYQCIFEEDHAYNFYTYDAIKEMVVELYNTATMLETDFDNQLLAPIVANYDVHYVHGDDSDAWETGDFGEMRDHINVVCDFYRRFAKHLLAMMERNPDAHLINIAFGY